MLRRRVVKWLASSLAKACSKVKHYPCARQSTFGKKRLLTQGDCQPASERSIGLSVCVVCVLEADVQETKFDFLFLLLDSENGKHA